MITEKSVTLILRFHIKRTHSQIPNRAATISKNLKPTKKKISNQQNLILTTISSKLHKNGVYQYSHFP